MLKCFGLKGKPEYLVIILDVYRVLLLLQSPQCVLQLRLKVLYLSGGHGFNSVSLTFCLDLLTVSDLIKKRTKTNLRRLSLSC